MWKVDTSRPDVFMHAYKLLLIMLPACGNIVVEGVKTIVTDGAALLSTEY